MIDAALLARARSQSLVSQRTLMAAIGLVVGGIVVLLYMPIFDLAGDMS